MAVAIHAGRLAADCHVAPNTDHRANAFPASLKIVDPAAAVLRFPRTTGGHLEFASHHHFHA